MSTKKYIEVQIPSAGFYESWHDQKIDDAIEGHFQDDNGDTPEGVEDKIWDADVDWAAIRNEYAKEFAEQFGHHFELDLEFVELTSPREYNFTTDRIFVKIPAVQINKIRKQVESYPEWPQVVRDNYTSYDGFSSFFSNDSSDDEWTGPVLKECQYLTIIEAWIQHQHDDDPNNKKEWNDLEYELVEDIEVYTFSSYNDAIDAIENNVKETK